MTAPSLEIAKQLHEAGRMAEAEAAYRAFLEQQPAHAGALFRLATLANQTGRPQMAVELLRRVTQYAPEFADAYNDLGVILRELGRFDEAMAASREAIRLKPDYAAAHVNLGNALTDVTRFNEGIEAYREAVRLRPDLAEAHGNLGMALMSTGKLEAGIVSLREGIRLKPDIVEIYTNLGNALLALGEVEGAAAAYGKTMEIDPAYADGHANLLLAMNYLPGIDPQEVAAQHRSWGERHALPLMSESMPFVNDQAPGRPLRIGYLSPDFRRHSVCYFFIPLLENRDRQMFKIFCYSSARKGDDLTEWVKRSCDSWREVVGITDQDVARLIRFDEIDILVDLSGHTSGNRSRMFARKPAPIEVTYLGYPNTTGISAMDYRLTDGLADPAGMTDALNVEKLWRLPTCAWCYRPLDRSPEIRPRAGGPTTFGCFNSMSKVNRQIIAIWAQLLHRVPDSRLLLKSAGAAQASARQRIIDQFDASGISRDRIEMLGHVGDTGTHLQTYDRVDVALDTFPYHGTTTTCEALWMGVPVVTLAGQIHVSRVGVSLLTNVGLTELIAQNAEQYVSIAAELAANPARLASLRTELRNRMTSSPLMDGRRFTREVEDAFRQMWQMWCSQGKREPRMRGSMAEQQLRSGMTHHQAGKLVEAERVYRKVLAGDPRNADAMQLLGTLAGQLGYVEAAVGLIRRAIEERPDYCEAHRNLGTLLAGQSRFDEAIAAYRKVFQFRPDDAEAHNDLGKVYLIGGQAENAIMEHSAAVRLQPNFADAHKCLGDSLRTAGRREEAIRAYAHAVGLKPNWAEARNGFAELLLEMKRSDEAIAEFARAAQLKPNFAQARFGLGNALQSLGRTADAVRAYAAAIEAKPDFAAAYYRLGQALKDSGQVDQALAAYQAALRIEPALLDAWNALGLALLGQGRRDEARACFGKAISISPGDPIADHNLGNIPESSPC